MSSFDDRIDTFETSLKNFFGISQLSSYEQGVWDRFIQSLIDCEEIDDNDEAITFSSDMSAYFGGFINKLMPYLNGEKDINSERYYDVCDEGGYDISALELFEGIRLIVNKINENKEVD